MSKPHRFHSPMLLSILCLVLSLCSIFSPSAAAANDGASAARSWEMFPDSGRVVFAEDFNAFFSDLSVEAVDSMQVVYTDPWGSGEFGPDLSQEPVRINPAEYPQITALLHELRFFRPERLNPATGIDFDSYLAVTSRGMTVKLRLWCSAENYALCGSLGQATLLDIEPEASASYQKLNELIDALPDVRQVRERLQRKSRLYFDAQLYQEEKRQGRALMNGAAVPPNPENPPALAVEAASVAEYNLFQDGYWARVTDPADQQKILNLVNSVRTDANPLGSSVLGGDVLLQLRLQNGEKHEYQTAKDGSWITVDGKNYFDQIAISVFDEALGEICAGYPVGAAWLGTMNRKNVTDMTVQGINENGRVYSLDLDPQELENAVSRLRGITLHGGSSRKVPRGTIPEELIGKTPGHKVELLFQNGIIYHIDFYGEKMLTIDSSDMSFSYFYQCDRIEEAGK